MGAACCKRLEAEPTSPHLPVCEVIRRCARIICPVDPPQQKPVFATRKYGLTDIAGPVVKKDSWAQTDPLPPPRHKRRSRQMRRRSRSVEFTPYLIGKGSRSSTASLEDIPHEHEDVFDFQMYFMDRLPNDTVNNGKDPLSDQKKEFLSGLLLTENVESSGLQKTDETICPEDPEMTVKEVGQEVLNKNFRTLDFGTTSIFSGAISSDTQIDITSPADIPAEVKSEDQETVPRTSGTSKVTSDNLAVEGITSRALNRDVEPKATETDGVCTSRRSSITESLREFESSLLEMLDEEDLSLKEIDYATGGPEYEGDIEIKMMVPFNKVELPTLVEEIEEDYVTSKQDEEDLKAIKIDQNNKNEVNNINNLDSIESRQKIAPSSLYNQYLNQIKNPPIPDFSPEHMDKISDVKIKEAPPKITVEIVS